MTSAKEARDQAAAGIEIRPGIYHHPRSPDASAEKPRAALGIIKLKQSIPLEDLRKMMEDDETEEETIDDHACT